MIEAEAELIEQIGPDAFVAEWAASFDALWPGCGQILLDWWHDFRAHLLRAGYQTAASSGADHELAYYRSVSAV
jgi:hypothetical protein